MSTVVNGGAAAAAMLRRGGANLLLCVGVAVLLAARPGARFADALIYSLCIGMLCWLVIDGGRLLVARALARRAAHVGDAAVAQYGWPGWGWMAGLVVVGGGAAFAAGSWLARAITGAADGTGTVWPGGTFALLLSMAVAVVATTFFYGRGRLAAARAEAEAARRAAAESRLKLLEAQLEPHMLFNTLANLRVLIGSDPPRAQAMLDRLIGFLRATLDASRSGATHALGDEFERLADYLALMGTRMGPRLTVQLDLPDALRAQPVPPLLLQPLVENAIRHGLEPKVEGGRIEVRAQRDGSRLLLSVRDTGVGLGAAASDGTGFGVAQVRDRLAALYGERAALTLEPADGADGSGTLARIDLPLPSP